MTASDRKGTTGQRRPPSALSQLLSGDVAGFDAALQETFRGPEGADLRRAHLLEQFATLLYDGDYKRAAKAMEIPHPMLGHRSPRELAETHEGMLQVKQLFAQTEKLLAQTKSPRARGVGAFMESIEEGWRDEFEPLVDLLPGAWGLSDEEFERLLLVPDGWLSAWRNYEVKIDEGLRNRLRRLRRFHGAFRLVVPPQEFAAAWRRVWERNSSIGRRSPWQAYQEDGDAALDTIEAYFWTQGP